MRARCRLVQAKRAVATALALGMLVGACVVTRPPKLDERPRWRLVEPAKLESTCVAARAFVRKSGKTGFGISVELKSRTDCHVQLAGGKLVFAAGPTVAVPALAPIDLRDHSVIHQWLPIRFDNDAAWDAERNVARLELAIIAGTTMSTWNIDVEQR